MTDSFERKTNLSGVNVSMETPLQNYLSILNKTQLEAVEALDGPYLILAGAGTGKTRVLTTRLAHILMAGQAKPWEVLAVTFTNKAAQEMKMRVSTFVNQSVEGWWVGTFHAIGARILRRHAKAVNLKPNFTILDTDDQVRLIKQLTSLHELEDKRWPEKTIAGIIQRWKDRGLMPHKVTLAEGSDVADGRILNLYADYQERLKVLNAADFGDLLLLCLEIFQYEPDILKELQHKFKYILVDEYQDTNVAQYLWLRLLAQSHKNICCVGDDDQSIYSWRGAEVANILRFEKDFPGAAVIRLEQNYRSTPHILGAASGLISHNQDRLGKTLWTQNNEGEKVQVRGVWDGVEEARIVCESITNIHSLGTSLDQIAILVRASFQTREFEERLITLAIPYQIVGGARFYERQEIRDAIAYFRVVAQPDDDLALERIINLPKRGIGNATMQTIHQVSRAQGIPLLRAILNLLDTDEFKPKVKKTLSELLMDFSRWRAMIDNKSLPELAGIILDESGYTEMWQQSKAMESSGRLENLKELIVALGEFENLSGFLEHVSLIMENEGTKSGEKVTIITLHGAKGLEFDTIFLPGWEDGLFPHQRSLDDLGSGGLEEERRLAYVGLTRAKKRALILHASSRRIYGKWQHSYPSRFLDELPAEHIDFIDNQGLNKNDANIHRQSLNSSSKYGKDTISNLAINKQRFGIFETRSLAQEFKVGERVFHQKFGYGHIVIIDGNKLEIDFEKAGSKKVVDSFVERNQ